ncbi:hypothetical protein J6590_057399 [Homalodisca vitripennis]|nr:hypothetical protein J6590_057399 [Homalodisca vitripennis]
MNSHESTFSPKSSEEWAHPWELLVGTSVGTTCGYCKWVHPWGLLVGTFLGTASGTDAFTTINVFLTIEQKLLDLCFSHNELNISSLVHYINNEVIKYSIDHHPGYDGVVCDARQVASSSSTTMGRGPCQNDGHISYNSLPLRRTPEICPTPPTTIGTHHRLTQYFSPTVAPSIETIHKISRVASMKPLWNWNCFGSNKEVH